MEKSAKPTSRTRRALAAIFGGIAEAMFGRVGSGVRAVALADGDAALDESTTPTEGSPDINVQTQGVSIDWRSATGAYDLVERETLEARTLFRALSYVTMLDTPDDEEACSPHMLVQSAAGEFSFIGSGGVLYSPDLDQDLTAREAYDIVTGLTELTPANPEPKPETPATRKLGWQGGVLLVLGLGALGLAVMLGAAVLPEILVANLDDDTLAAATVAGMLGFTGLGFIYVAIKHRT